MNQIKYYKNLTKGVWFDLIKNIDKTKGIEWYLRNSIIIRIPFWDTYDIVKMI